MAALPRFPASFVLAYLVFLACSQADAPVDPSAEQEAVRYHDTGLVSLNAHCPVTGARLNPNIEPIYANGRPIGFC